MKLCPVACLIHCVGCPFLKICPLKGLLGDYGKYPPVEEKPAEILVKCPHGPTRPKWAQRAPRTTNGVRGARRR